MVVPRCWAIRAISSRNSPGTLKVVVFGGATDVAYHSYFPSYLGPGPTGIRSARFRVEPRDQPGALARMRVAAAWNMPPMACVNDVVTPGDLRGRLAPHLAHRLQHGVHAVHPAVGVVEAPAGGVDGQRPADARCARRPRTRPTRRGARTRDPRAPSAAGPPRRRRAWRDRSSSGAIPRRRERGRARTAERRRRGEVGHLAAPSRRRSPHRCRARAPAAGGGRGPARPR